MKLKSPINLRFAPALALATALFTGMPVVSPAQGLAADSMGEVERLTHLSADNGNPSLAFSPNGKQLFVTWDGIVNGSRRILLREQVEGVWLPAVVLDSNPAGSNSSPSIAVDQSGTPHVAWITTDANGQRSPRYARRLSREPNSWYQQEVPFPSESNSASNCDFLNLQLDDLNRPWIVWQHGYGNVYNIAASSFNEAGEIVTADLTPGASTHNLYPEIFFLPEPTVYWYMWESDQFFLIGSKFDEAANDWKLTLPEGFELVPGSNLPDIFRTGRGPLAAIWYDRLVTEDGEEPTDRIFLGVQNEQSQGRGEAISPSDGSSNDSVAATSVLDKLITVWISETYETGTQVILGVGNSPDSVVSVPVSPATEFRNSNPKVAATAGKAVVAWEQETGIGQPNSAILIRSIELK